MSCNISNNKWDDLLDFNKAGLDGLNEYIDDLKSKGIEPKVIGKFGGVFGDAIDVAKAGNQVSAGNIKGAVATVSGAFFGGVGAAAGYAVAGFLFPGLGLVGAIVLAGTAGALIGDLAESITESMLDPTLEPKFHEELLRNREQRLREKGIDPATDPGVANMRRQLALARERAGMCDEVNDKVNDAVTFAPRDPLALDLDNDGIETIAINPTAPILFDHNGDGAPSATGWLKGDDGWLVNDLDQDGKITSGKELLGVDTDITVGGVTRKATTGFEALRALDSHQDGDGKNLFDSRDAAFSQLRIWQDKNQNGVTDAGELSTLSALGIVSIQLQETATNINLGGGNSVTGKALVTRRVGTSTSTSEVDSVLVTNDSAANLNLADNPFYTDLPDVAVTDAARALPNMQGSGLVHSLREAMSLADTSNASYITRALMKTAAQNLTATVTAFTAAKTRDEQRALLDTLIQQWGATSSLDTSEAFVFMAPGATGTTAQRVQTFAQQNPELYKKIIALEQFNGQQGLATLMNRWNVTLPPAVTDSLNSAYNALKESVYSALAVQTRLKPYFDAIELVIDEQGLRFDLTKMQALVSSTQSTDITKAITDVLELNQFASDTMTAVGFDSASTLRSLLASAPSNLPLLSQLPALGLFQASSTIGSAKKDVYLGDQGNNTFKAGDGADLLSGGSGADNLYGDAGDDTLDGGAGNDALFGSAGSDTFLFGKGDGQDRIYAPDEYGHGTVTDSLNFKAWVLPGDVSLRRSGNYLLIEIAGTTDSVTVENYFLSDATTGYALAALRFSDGTTWDTSTVKAKVLQSTSGNDSLTGYATDDSIAGGAGNDTLYGEGSNDTLDGGSGNDYLFGGAGTDTYLFGIGDGQDTINAPDAYGRGSIADSILFKTGVVPSNVTLRRIESDLLIKINGTTDRVTVENYFLFDATAGYALDTLRFADGTTWDTSTVKAKVLQSTAGNDTLTGYASDDAISGGSGNDTLYGGPGNDTLEGGSGNDYLFGGNGSYWSDSTGDDVYLFGRGAGQDTISNGSIEAAGSSHDTILLGADITPADLTLAHSGDDLIIRLNGTSDSLRVVGYFERDGVTSSAVERIKFAGGSVWNYADVKSKAMAPTTGDDRLHGYAANDTINSGAGNDAVYGYAGDDSLEGGTGTDSLYGGDGNDSIQGNENNDQLYGEAGSDTLKGGTGIDALYGGADNDSLQGNEDNDYLRGDDGNDTLDGGSGSDDLRGGAGSDVYLFGRGSGQDTIYNEDSDSVGVNPDTISLGPNITASDVTLVSSSDDLIILLNGTNDSLLVNDYFSSNGASSSVVEYLKFSDGTTWDVKKVLSQLAIGTDGPDVLYGTPNADVINGRAGNDTIHAGLGSDTYLFGKGDGRDVIGAIDDPATGKVDTLLFKPGVAPTEVTFGTAPNPLNIGAWDGDALVIKIAGTTDQITIQDFLNTGDPVNPRNPLQQIKFDDGTTWNISTILKKLYAGTEFADRIDGTSKGELITGGAGNDSLYGQGGRDTLDGGTGNDYINGDGEDDVNDTYLFGKGDGQDTIGAISTSEPDVLNTLRFKTGIAPTEVTLSTRYGDLEIKISNTNDRIIVEDFLDQDTPNNSRNPLQEIKFPDGTTWNIPAILKKLFAGTESAETINGTYYSEAINGRGGDDFLYGIDGDDTLDGGTGNDYIDGGLGSDTCLFGKGDGQDVVVSANNLSFKSGVAPSEVKFGTSETSLIITIAGTSDQITIKDFFYQNTPINAINPLQQIQFTDGTKWDLPAILSRLPSGTDSGDVLYGASSGDVINGLAGKDTIYGNGGNDLLNGGTGADTMVGGSGNDVYYVDNVNDLVIETTPAEYDRIVASVDYVLPEFVEDMDLAAGAANALRATGNTQDNVLAGNEFNNILSGGDGDDYLLGDVGTDTMIGGAGNDRFYVDNIGDEVQEDASSGYDTVHLFFLQTDSYTLSDNVEAIEVIDVTPVTAGFVALHGNALNNSLTAGDFAGMALYGEAGDDGLFGSGGNDTLYGGTGSDVLWGATGLDSMFGGAGDDQYYVSEDGDQITELANEGTDTVTLFGLKGISYKMAAHLENLDIFEVIPSSSSSFTVFGNAQDNVIDGSGSASRVQLSGGVGNDQLFGTVLNDLLVGGAGNDTLYGGFGSDTYSFSRGNGQDVIDDADASVGNLDQLTFGTGVANDQLWFRQSGQDLVVSVIGSTDQVTIRQWSAGASHRVERITAGGKSLADTQVMNLVQAMSAMTPPPIGQSTLSDAQRAQLAPVLAANWA